MKEGDVMASEKNFENRVKRFLKDEGCYFIKYWGGGEFTKAGVPDILCCCNGFFIGIEVKSATGRPSALQLHNLHLIDEAHGFGVLLYPKDFTLFQNFIQCIGQAWDEGITANYQILKKGWCEQWVKLHK